MSKSRTLVLATIVLAGALLQGCASAPTGPRFTTLEAAPVAADKGNVYVYRKAAMHQSRAKYKVKDADGNVLGELANATYLVLPVAPGKREFKVDEGLLSIPKSFEVEVQPGRNHFVEYDSSMGLLVGYGVLSKSTVRTEDAALADLKSLTRAN